MNKDECFLLGYVEKPHGIQGEVVMVFDTDEPAAYEDIESVFVEVKGRLVPYFIQSLRLRGNKAIVKLEDVGTIEKAMPLKGCQLYLPEDILPELDETQFYFHEIIGFDVVDKEKGRLGKVESVYNLPQQDLIAMNYMGAEVLIPLTEAIVTEVNREKGEIYTQLPNGLLELYLEEETKKREN